MRVRFASTVHGEADNCFVAMTVAADREHDVAGYPGDGTNRLPAVHRSVANQLEVPTASLDEAEVDEQFGFSAAFSQGTTIRPNRCLPQRSGHRRQRVRGHAARPAGPALGRRLRRAKAAAAIAFHCGVVGIQRAPSNRDPGGDSRGRQTKAQ
jgi:hypothetical protein